MRVWLITVGEPLPIPGAKGRLLRTGLLAEALYVRGHEITWWTSTFDHWNKRHYFSRDAVAEIAPGYQIRLLKGPGYRRNVSFGRIIDHYLTARKFAGQARLEERPDVILCSLPTINLAGAAVKFGCEAGVPVVVDIRDMWPDIFLELVPNQARRPARFFMKPMFRAVRSACSGAAAITGHAPAFVEWGLRNAGRSRTERDRDFPYGYKSEPPSAQTMQAARGFWSRLGLSGEGDEFVVCFFGTIGRYFELETVIKAARLLGSADKKIRFVLCGAGESLSFYKGLAVGCENVTFPGWIGAAQIKSLMSLSSVGLAPYRNSSSFVISIPNKAIEYLSAGLPIVSSLKGVLKDLLTANDCGLHYENGDAKGLAAALCVLSESPSRRKILGKNALALFKKRFAAKKVYHDMSVFLEETAAKEKGLN
ncbi:MAG: glycosyltransferase family 4 protein [Thermodesulfobacteriota bacterium]|nr:glycosyltransferase family 4 protein [Thermodesulfobacteriota bacterium]